MRSSRLQAAAAALAALCLAPAPAAAQDEAAHGIAALNAQRAAHGIPAGIVEDPAWSAGCAQHMGYVRRNRVLTHDEDPSKPGYTVAGAAAGAGSVLSLGRPWFAGGANPWEDAPLHLMQLLAPDLSVTGAADGCMVTWPGYKRPAPSRPVLLSYPGAGATGVPAAQTASESPFVPGDFVGLPEGTTTGPHLYLLGWGTGTGRVTAATLAGPAGPVAVRTVDNQTGQVGTFLPPGGIVIPVEPLAPGTTYALAATFAGRHKVSRTFSFTTAGAAAPPTTAGLSLDATAARQRERSVLTRGLALRGVAPQAGTARVVLRVGAGAVARGTATVGTAGAFTARVALAHRARAALRRHRGTVRVHVQVSLGAARAARHVHVR